MSLFYVTIGSAVFVSLVSLVYLFFAQKWVKKQESGLERMNMISERIAEGAVSFLRTEYKCIGVVVVFTSFLLWFLGWNQKEQVSVFRVFNYVVGAGLSMLAGFIGMRIATCANVRVAQAARSSLSHAFRISFVGGTIMGVGVVAFALLGMGVLLVLTLWVVQGGSLDLSIFGAGDSYEMRMVLEVLTGFAFGTETIALFARVAGGIYTKAADIGADIVGKTEVGIPEDDPRNPATIADNVGDNVGDIAGMGADLFGSYISTFLAAIVLGMHDVRGCEGAFFLPWLLGTLGLVVSLGMFFWVRLKKEDGSVQGALNIGNIGSMVLVGVLSCPLLYMVLPKGDIYIKSVGMGVSMWSLYGVVVIGVVVSFVVSWITEYFTSMKYRPVQFIASQSTTGPATNLIAGLSVGMFSTVVPMVVFALAVMGAFYLGGFYGIALAAVSMMSTTGMQLAIDAFGPIADNAGGIAEMAQLPGDVRVRTDALDAVGNTTAAAGKGYAIASAALTSLALFASFHASLPRVLSMELFADATVVAGLFLGAIVPFLFSGLIINSVGKAAMKMVCEVRRQFKEIPGLLDGEVMPDYQRCVSIATGAALREMLLPGALALVSPVVVGLCLGAKMLASFLTGVVVTGVIMALFQCNAGGAWDNAKKFIEKSGVDGMGKGSDAHRAAVVGDTVGDPFKDTSGPAMNILIKLTIIVALVIVHYL